MVIHTANCRSGGRGRTCHRTHAARLQRDIRRAARRTPRGRGSRPACDRSRRQPEAGRLHRARRPTPWSSDPRPSPVHDPPPRFPNRDTHPHPRQHQRNGNARGFPVAGVLLAEHVGRKQWACARTDARPLSNTRVRPGCCHCGGPTARRIPGRSSRLRRSTGTPRMPRKRTRPGVRLRQGECHSDSAPGRSSPFPRASCASASLTRRVRLRVGNYLAVAVISARPRERGLPPRFWATQPVGVWKLSQ